MTRVKILGSILTCLILFHGVCLARCLGEGSRIATESALPPCHHSQETPNHNDSPMPIPTCIGGPALEAKSFPTLKCSLELVVLPGAIPALTSIMDHPVDGTNTETPHASPPLLLRSILRI